MKYISNPIIRYFHLQNEQYILDLLNEEYYSVDMLENNLLFDIMSKSKNSPLTKSEIVEYIMSNYEIDKTSLNKFIEELINAKLLLNITDFRRGWLESKELWDLFNWKEAYVYQTFNNAKKKLDYSTSGYTSDLKYMEEYRKEKAPPSLYKDYNEKYKKISLGEESKISNKNLSVKDVMLAEKSKKSSITFDQISYLLKMVFGIQGTRKGILGDEYLLKTSPSGGIKHPSECYMITTDSLKMDQLNKNTVYHYSVSSHSLMEMEVLSNIDFNKICPLIKNNSNDYSLIIIISNIFERSMYRYRESRSFKPVNIDVGHLLSSASLVLDSLNISYDLSHSTSFDYVNSLLKIDGLKEPSICYLAIK